MINIKDVISANEEHKIIRQSQPVWIEPMLATLTHEYFSDNEWIYERKLDGERCLVFKKNDNINMMSRNRKKINFRYPDIEKALVNQESKDFIIDGEIVAFNNKVTSFSKLQKRMHSNEIKEIINSGVKVYYYIFDILYINGYNLMDISLRTRKKILKRAFDYKDPIRYTIYRNKTGLKFFDEACSKNWEGLIAKDANATYINSRSKKWLKFKCSNRQKFIICGFTEPQGERLGFGSLLLGYYKNNKLLYAGKVGTGFDDEMLLYIRNRLDDLEIDKSHFADDDFSNNNVHWVKPEMVIEVSFTQWTHNGKLRHPSFQGVRNDKKSEKVVK